MRSYKDQLKEVSMQIKAGKPAKEIESKEVIAEDDKRVLVRIVGVIQYGSGMWSPDISYQIWLDKLMYKRNITTDSRGGRQRIYVCNLSGPSEEDVLKAFHCTEAFSPP